MKRRLLVVAVLMALLGACTPTIYGVPETTWQQMSEPERVAAMEAYRQRQIVLQQAQAERARQRAIAQEAERQRQAELEERRQRQIDAIYRGRGVYGDLLQVTLSDGMINFSGKHRSYPPQTFRIAQGETRDVPVVDDKGRRRAVRVSYNDGTLVLDSRGAKPNQVARFNFDSAWEEGISFPPVETKGDAELRGVRVAVSVLGEPPHRHRQHQAVVAQPPPPQVIVVQAPAPPPPQVVVIQQPDRHPRQGEHKHQHREPEHPAPVVVVPAPHLPTPVAPPVRSDQPAPVQRQPEMEQARHQQPRPAEPAPVHREDPPPVVVIPPPAVIVAEPPSRRPPPDQQHRETRNAEHRHAPSAPAATDRAPQRVRIKFRNGQVKIKGKYVPFTPAEYLLGDGETRQISLQTPQGDLLVTLMYQGGKVSLDPQSGPGQGRGKREFAAESGWSQGKAYRFDSPGEKLLRQVEVEVVSDHSG